MASRRTDREISLPFRVGPSGSIATTSDPARRGKQHITTYLLTDPGERVMRPDFGTPLRGEVFENLDPLRNSLLVHRINDRVSTDVADVVLRNIGTAIDSEQSELRLTVEFALAVGNGEGESRTTTISLGGAA